MAKAAKKLLSGEQQNQLLSTLETRFSKNMKRHKEVSWDAVKKKLEASPEKLWSLYQMEETGGEPDVVAFDDKTKTFIFFDCAPETPKGRRSICYDQDALDARKENKPKHSAVGMAEEMGVKLLSEDEYRQLQQLGNFDQKTSSWIATPDEIRELDGSLFGDYRFGRVFFYHNGSSSYYAGRGFRSSLSV